MGYRPLSFKSPYRVSSNYPGVLSITQDSILGPID